MVLIQHIGNGHPAGIRTGTSRPWAPQEARHVPGTTAADLLERYPGRFRRVDTMDRAMRSPEPTLSLPDGVGSRHWRTLVAEVARGEHDAHLYLLSEQTTSEAVRGAVQSRAQALRAG